MRHPPPPPANVVMTVTSLLWQFQTSTYAYQNNCSVPIWSGQSAFTPMMKQYKTIGYYIKNNRRTIEWQNVMISSISLIFLHILNIGWGGRGFYSGVSLRFVQDCLKNWEILLYKNHTLFHYFSCNTSFLMFFFSFTFFPLLFTSSIALMPVSESVSQSVRHNCPPKKDFYLWAKKSCTLQNILQK